MQKSILLIEDEEALCDMLHDELTLEGYKVHKAYNGVEGLEKLRTIEPDLVICDRAMPAMTGTELLERIRGIYPQYRNLPFIFLTALTIAEGEKIIDDLQPSAYLEKPIDFKRLKTVIREKLAEAA